MKALLFAVCFAAGSALAETLISVEREGEAIKVTATTSVAVGRHLAWNVLTDYDHLADFVPDMRSSRVVSGPCGPLEVEQKGETGFLVWKFPVEVVLALEEEPEHLITFRSVSGNIKNMHGSWRVTRETDGVTLEYSARMETDFWLPPLIGPVLIEYDIRRKVDAVAAEMVRRSRAASETR
jgi:hypothetical protein